MQLTPSQVNEIETDNLTLIERIRLYSDVVNYSIIVGNGNCGFPNARKALLIELTT